MNTTLKTWKRVAKILKYNVNVRERSTFDALYTKYWEPLFLFAYKISGSKELSQDVVQEVFFNFWQNNRQAAVQNIEAYLFQSVKYQIFNHFKDKRFNTLELNESFETYLVEQLEEDDTVNSATLLDLLETLPEKRKEIVYLNKFQGLSISEIALELDLSHQTVKNQLHRAIKHLKASLKEAYGFFF
ncbi:RNA polymerase sigma factor [Zhouia amylolytica]|uniref:RNA polymerase ECF-type sigma factor n=1 Tax=Zhouia amylolytica AD3 TaxID=1286632 RepID=W2UN01_9FLAO|nr:sigma-70 family RNA polymerase sigma factor [Zhouia amylolytica]ETN94846.1 hypothetical protein P278_27890 [Zhouia amylolytica AD3]MCQ0111026.1 sigma-70 family RNA polymerase sigma factor [Zhouia amylolytica]